MRQISTARTWIRRVGRWAWPAWLCAILAGCTGTFEARPPTLLVVAFDDGGPSVALVRDTFNALQPGESRALEFLAGSERPLPAPAVSVDVVDRAGTRPTAVFLLRDPVTDVTYLRGFSLQDIDPDDPNEFAQDAFYAHLLANGGPTGDEGLLEQAAADAYCPTDVQASASGRYVAVFEARSECGEAEFRAIHVIDLEAVAANDADPVVSIVSPAPGAAGIYLDQDGELDREGRGTLYWVDPIAGVKAFDLGTGSVRTLDVAGAAFDPGAIRDIGRILDRLVLVADDELILVDPIATPPSAAAVDSASALTMLVTDPFAVTDDAVLLAGNALVVHPDAFEPEFAEESSPTARSDATLDPIDRFVYLLSSERIGVFDLLEFQGENVVITTFPVPEIPDADVLTWTRATLDAVP